MLTAWWKRLTSSTGRIRNAPRRSVRGCRGQWHWSSPSPTGDRCSRRLNNPSSDPGLPLVVQIGFAGSRRLYDSEEHPDVDPRAFEQAVQLKLQVIRGLGDELRLGPKRFFCGVSQIAAGPADSLHAGVQRAEFAAANLSHPAARRLSDGAKRRRRRRRHRPGAPAACELLDSPHVVQERVASDAIDREARFEEANIRSPSLATC